MYRTFNMGIGLVVVCPESEADRTVRIFKKHRQDAMRIGRVEKKPGIRIKGKLLRE
jgi:phosphoribosylaminoimidazole (AIR) synthetase